MTIIRSVCTAAFVLAASGVMPGEPGRALANEAGGTKVSMWSYLEQVGRRFDCYFTVEQVEDCLNKVFEPDATVKTIPDMEAALCRRLKGYEVRRSDKNPAVFRIAAVKLLSNPAYWMEKHIDLSFQGTPSNLQLKIWSCAGLTHPLQWSTDFPPRLDLTTKVTVSGKGLSARCLLTDFMPLSQYSRVLWSATTRMDDLKPSVTVSFGGPTKSEDALSDEVVPFSEGDVAFYRNRKSPEAVAAATDFIKEQMKAEKPFQVRWAMLYLGKQVVADALPLLLEHLKYKYTTCGVLEESYPAALALSMMGKAGAASALKALATETDGLRLKLLCRVVLLIEGQDPGAKTIEAEAAKVADAKQQQRIRDALKSLAEPQAESQTPPAR